MIHHLPDHPVLQAQVLHVQQIMMTLDAVEFLKTNIVIVLIHWDIVAIRLVPLTTAYLFILVIIN